ncbi:MAG: hypothetical protein PHT97_11415 [Methanoculleus sp.]|uniref:hypothetical protein n=1 Tax=Methanoculleus sp. TaxID=90427 RepID=UPI00260D4E5B|nr:hypothetical protein [Methanoculleus sp.]MDD2259271.1 hypothetical protein [Bacilli bacterium]MDD4471752.1 hypothetical protein [Methanoculleus sp.]
MCNKHGEFHNNLVPVIIHVPVDQLKRETRIIGPGKQVLVQLPEGIRFGIIIEVREDYCFVSLPYVKGIVVYVKKDDIIANVKEGNGYWIG